MVMLVFGISVGSFVIIDMLTLKVAGFEMAAEQVSDLHEPTELELDWPGVSDGARGVRIIERVVENAAGIAKWSPI